MISLMLLFTGLCRQIRIRLWPEYAGKSKQRIGIGSIFFIEQLIGSESTLYVRQQLMCCYDPNWDTFLTMFQVLDGF